jgi:hypothetical protein
LGSTDITFSIGDLGDIIDGETSLSSQQIHFMLSVTKCSKAILLFRFKSSSYKVYRIRYLVLL